jgi:hypothetical protein
MVEDIDAVADPSLFADNSYQKTSEMIASHSDEITFYIPETFHSLAMTGEVIDDEDVRDFFSSHTSFYEYQEMASYMEEMEIETFQANQHAADLSEYYKLISSSVGGSISVYREGNNLADILFEEFVFSLNNSPILSRLKKSIERIADAGSYTITMSKNKVSEIWDLLRSKSTGDVHGYADLMSPIDDDLEETLGENDPVSVSAYLSNTMKDYAPNWIGHVLENYISRSIGATGGAAVGSTVGQPILGAGLGGLFIGGAQDISTFIVDP